MKFSEMKYERPDLVAVKDGLHALTERLKASRDYAEAREAFLAHEAAYIHMEMRMRMPGRARCWKARSGRNLRRNTVI